MFHSLLALDSEIIGIDEKVFRIFRKQGQDLEFSSRKIMRMFRISRREI